LGHQNISKNSCDRDLDDDQPNISKRKHNAHRIVNTMLFCQILRLIALDLSRKKT
jgi:hypothetical protein